MSRNTLTFHICSGLAAVTLASVGLLPGAARAEFLWDVASGDASKVEMLFLAWESNSGTGSPKVFFAKDLGMTMAEFYTSAQVDAGVQFSWMLGGTGASADDANWTTFLDTTVTGTTKVDPSKVRWAVMGISAPDTGSFLPDSVRLFSTNLQGTSGSATTIPGWSTVGSQALNDMVGSSLTLYGAVASAGTMGSTTIANGSAAIPKADLTHYKWLDFEGDDADFTFGSRTGGGRSIGNLMGNSSWFYYITDGDANGGYDGSIPVQIDEFDNLGSDGYWGLTQSTVAGKTDEYFLSYTLAGYKAAAEVSNHVLYGNNFARLAGVLSLDSPSGRAGSVLSLTTDFVRGFVAGNSTLRTAAAVGLEASDNLAAVPEPGTWGLMGLGALAVLARRRAARTARPAGHTPAHRRAVTG